MKSKTLKGNFDDQLITSIINNIKKTKSMKPKKYGDRASVLMDAFISELDWRDQLYVNDLSKIKKKKTSFFANKYFGDNYVAVLKRKRRISCNCKIENHQLHQ